MSALPKKHSVGLEHPPRALVGETGFEHHQRKSQPIHCIEDFPVEHPSAVQRHEGELEFDTDTATKEKGGARENLPFVTLYVELEEQTRAVQREFLPNVVQPSLLDGFVPDVPSLRRSVKVLLEHRQNRTAGAIVPGEVERHQARVPSESSSHRYPGVVTLRAGFKLGESLACGLECHDSVAVSEATKVQAVAAVARSYVEHAIHAVRFQQAGAAMSGLPAREPSDVQSEALNKKTRAVEERHRL
jgi:hypothetical protein